MPMNTAPGATGEYHNALLQMALQASETGLWTWDIASDEITWTPLCFRIMGIDPDVPPPSGEHFMDLVHPDDREHLKAVVGHAIQARQPYECEFRVLRRDGCCRWVVNQGRALYDREGNPVHLLGTVRDVTERRAHDAALAESEAQFRATFDNAAVGMAIFAPDGRWLAVNDRLCEIVGHPRERLLGAYFQDITHPDDLGANMAMVNRLLAGEQPHDSVEKRYLRGDGGEIWAHVTASVRRDAHGVPVHIIAVIQDISDRRAAEQKLMASEERLARAQRAAHVGTWDWWIATGQGCWTDEAWKLFAGGPRDEPITVDLWRSCLHPLDRARVGQSAVEVQAGRPYFDEYRVLHPDGTVLWLQSQGEVIADERGVPVRMVGTVRDITAHKRDEAAQQAAARQKDEFLATLAHELRNPLAPLRSGLEVLKRVDLDHPSALRARQAMDRQLSHLVRLVDDLLDVSRISRGKVTLQRAPVTVEAIVAHALEGSRSAIELRGHALDVQLPPYPLFVDGDLTRLAQVVGNLVNNAAKYTPQGGHIAVQAIARQGLLEISVADDGMGMTPQTLESAFELFMQAEETRGHSQGGLGIGLALVRQLTELHGGSVHAESAGLGYGSRFTVILPLLQEG